MTLDEAVQGRRPAARGTHGRDPGLRQRRLLDGAPGRGAGLQGDRGVRRPRRDPQPARSRTRPTCAAHVAADRDRGRLPRRRADRQRRPADAAVRRADPRRAGRRHHPGQRRRGQGALGRRGRQRAGHAGRRPDAAPSAASWCCPTSSPTRAASPCRTSSGPRTSSSSPGASSASTPSSARRWPRRTGAVKQRAESHGTDLRSAAFCIGVERVATAAHLRGYV